MSEEKKEFGGFERLRRILLGELLLELQPLAVKGLPVRKKLFLGDLFPYPQKAEVAEGILVLAERLLKGGVFRAGTRLDILGLLRDAGEGKGVDLVRDRDILEEL